MKHLYKCFSLVLILLLLIVGINCFESSKSLKVGVVLPLTGDLSDYGLGCKQGIELAVSELNTQGYKINLLFRDNQSNDQQTRSQIFDAIDKDKVNLIIGALTSSNTLAGAGIAQSTQVPIITPTATNDEVTQIGNYVSRICLLMKKPLFVF